MKTPNKTATFKGRFLGIAVLVFAQFAIGIIHLTSGFALLSGTFLFAALSLTSVVYSSYTVVYGLLTTFFAYWVCVGKRGGWFGTVAVSLFVIIADVLTVMGLPIVPGIPKFAAFGEIPYSGLVLVYLIQEHVRAKYQV